MAGLSLKALGLRAVDGLDCPNGGQHDVREADVRRAAAELGGGVLCLKCGNVVRLEVRDG